MATKKKRTGLGIAITAIGVALIVVGITQRFDFGGHDGSDAPPATTDAQIEKNRAAARNAATRMIYEGLLDEAEQVLNRLLELYPDDAEGHQLMAQVILGRAEPDAAAAYHHLTRSLEIDAKQAMVEFQAGVVAQSSLDQPVVAIGHFQRASVLEPADAKYALYLGQALLAADRLAEAERQLDRAIQLDATLADAYAMQAEIAARHGTFAESIVAVNRAIEHARPQKRVSFIVLKAALLRRAGEPEQGLRILLELTDPEQAIKEVVLEEVRCHEAMDNPAAAAEAWDRRLAADATDFDAAINAGMLYVKIADWKRARTCLVYAERLRPNSDETLKLANAIKDLRQTTR